MARRSAIWMLLRPEKDLKLFVVEQGSDIFLPLFIWPESPVSVEINSDIFFNDIRVTKNVLIINNEDCNGKDNYKYSGNDKYNSASTKRLYKI